MRNNKMTIALTMVMFMAQSTGAADLLILTAHAAPLHAFTPIPPAALRIPALKPGLPPAVPAKAASKWTNPLPSWLSAAKAAGTGVFSALFDTSDNPFLTLQSEALLAMNRPQETFDLYPQMNKPDRVRIKPARSNDATRWLSAGEMPASEEPVETTAAVLEPPAADLAQIIPFTPVQEPPDTTRRITTKLQPLNPIMNITQLGGFEPGLRRMSLSPREASQSSAFMGKPRQAHLYAARKPDSRRRIASMVKIASDPSKPFGQRNVYDVTYNDGSRDTVTASPLVFDLSGSGVRTSVKRILFDIIGKGRRDHLNLINDIEDGMGVLAFDPDGDGRSGENGLELFGSASDINGDGRADGHSDGFAALEALVRRAVHEGVLPRETLSRDRLLAFDLAALGARYGLKMKLGGLNRPAVTLNQAGVVEIKLSRKEVFKVKDFDGQGNDVSRKPGAEFTRPDGTTGAYEDVWFAHRAP